MIVYMQVRLQELAYNISALWGLEGPNIPFYMMIHHVNTRFHIGFSSRVVLNNTRMFLSQNHCVYITLSLLALAAMLNCVSGVAVVIFDHALL